MGGNCGRGLFDHGQPRHRSAHRAEIASGAQSAAVGAGVAREWRGCIFSVWIISHRGRDAVCLLPGSVGGIWTGRQNLSNVHCEPDAAWDCGTVDRRDSGSSHVELERGIELAVVEFDYGFLSSLSSRLWSGAERRGALANGAAGDDRMGARAVRPGGAGAASGGARGGGRAANRIRGLWGVAWSVSAGCADSAR